ncbi:hypothetical protein [Paraburkholderia heleia]|uniref:hypothetical protein n=1 Tax=Paraburkholderia heleia TaxID=634127 RepID=UPI002AB5F58B|nr:hypothetical protein [Paraburkholderia heleia]
MDRLIASNSVPMAQADAAPVSGTPQGATDGNPATNVPATRWPSYQYNAIQEELIAILTAANVTPDRTNNAQIIAAIRTLITQSAAVIGDRRNLVSSVAAASATKTVTADEIVVGSALGGQKYVLANFSGTGNLATTGVNGMDTGSAPTNGFVAEYAIFNPSTGAKGVLYQNATSAVAPNVYGGANMPNGYTASALTSVWPTNSSGQFAVAYQADRTVLIVPSSILSTSAQAASPTALSIAGAVPKNAKFVNGTGTINSSSASTNIYSVQGSTTYIGQGVVSIGTSSANTGIQGQWPRVPLITPQTIYYMATVTAGTMSVSLSVTGYEF